MKSNEKIKTGEAAAMAAKLRGRGIPASIANAIAGKERKQVAAEIVLHLRQSQVKRK